jgi:putative DNA primase/helicase
MMTSREFLALLFGHPSLAGLKIAIWDKQTQQTETFTLPDLEAAAVSAERRGATKDVYAGICPYTDVAPGKRGDESKVGAMVGIWLDVDVRNDAAHSRTDLPPNDVAAFDLVYECPKPPSVIVHSGYGLHVWWVFKTPFMIHNDRDRTEARRISDGWVEYMNGLAKRHGWALDPVGNLALMTRLPGTRNHKIGEGRAVATMRRKVGA